MGKLYICGTPIGNLEDVSIRLLKTLRRVDLIACEDTRHTIKLLNRYKIKNHLISYHEYSDHNKEQYILNEVLAGKEVALVCNAGMPTISDPGARLIKKAIDAGISLEAIPGPSALTVTLALAGINSSSFVFEGFLPNKKGKRQAKLLQLKDEERTVIIYEAPHRLLDTLADIVEIMGPDRQIVVARELTKKHEELIRGTAEEVFFLMKNKDGARRGEFSIAIEGHKEQVLEEDVEKIADEVELLIQSGVKKKEALKQKAQEYKVKKSSIYKLPFKRRI